MAAARAGSSRRISAFSFDVRFYAINPGTGLRDGRWLPAPAARARRCWSSAQGCQSNRIGSGQESGRSRLRARILRPTNRIHLPSARSSDRRAWRGGRGCSWRASATPNRPAATAAKVSGSVALTSNSRPRISRAPASAMTEPSADAGNRQPAAFADHHAHHVRRLRADRHAHADLVRALRDRIGDDAVDADGCQRERQAAEQREEQHVEPPIRCRIRQHLIHRRDVGDAELRVHRVDRRARVARRRTRIVRRPQHPRHGGDRRRVLPAVPELRVRRGTSPAAAACRARDDGCRRRRRPP